MSEALETLRNLIDQCSEEDRKALKLYLQRLLPHPLEQLWGIEADTILSAINRSSDLTKRGVRGIIAEAVLVNEILPTVVGSGWQPEDFSGDQPFDALVKKGLISARIQVKLQRLEQGKPKLYYPRHYGDDSLFVVEVQKTRTGERTAKSTLPGAESTKAANQPVIVKTRPYSFGDFDILAVNMHPSTGSWLDFRYTVASWLLPRPSRPDLIEIFQPVAAHPNEVWSDNLGTCLAWFEGAGQRRVLNELLHLRKQ